MAKYVKGQTGNPNGRPIGSENRTTRETRKLLISLLSGQLEKIPQQLDELDTLISKENNGQRKFNLVERKLNLVIKLLPYFVPTLKNESFSNFDSSFASWGEL